MAAKIALYDSPHRRANNPTPISMSGNLPFGPQETGAGKGSLRVSMALDPPRRAQIIRPGQRVSADSVPTSTRLHGLQTNGPKAAPTTYST